jgi:hypothetical protein
MRTWPGSWWASPIGQEGGPGPDWLALRRPRVEPLSAAFNVVGNDSAAQESTLCSRSRTLQAGREVARGLGR